MISLAPMRRLALVALLCTILFPVSSEAGDVLVFRVGKVITFDADDRVVNRAVVIVEDGRITAVGKAGEVEIPAGATVLDKPRHWLVPGMVDAHNHTGGSSPDLHDYVFLTNPGYRTLESVVTESNDIDRARAGGITSALLIPGSGNNMSGFGTVMDTGGGSVEDAVIKAYGSIKIAQAGNPENFRRPKSATPALRPMVAKLPLSLYRNGRSDLPRIRSAA